MINRKNCDKGTRSDIRVLTLWVSDSFRCECLKSLRHRSLLLIDAGRADVPNDRWWSNEEYDRGMRSLFASAERRWDVQWLTSVMNSRVSNSMTASREDTCNTLTLMRFKPRFSAVVQSQRTAGNRKYTAKIVEEPYWQQSKRKHSATFRKTTAGFRLQKYSYKLKRTAAKW